jgi:hypothetical protein
LQYTWFPQRRGFERNTLNAENVEHGGYKCDVIIGVPRYDSAMTTRPYYRSTYALVYVAAEVEVATRAGSHRAAAGRARGLAHRCVHAGPGGRVARAP